MLLPDGSKRTIAFALSCLACAAKLIAADAAAAMHEPMQIQPIGTSSSSSPIVSATAVTATCGLANSLQITWLLQPPLPSSPSMTLPTTWRRGLCYGALPREIFLAAVAPISAEPTAYSPESAAMPQPPQPIPSRAPSWTLHAWTLHAQPRHSSGVACSMSHSHSRLAPRAQRACEPHGSGTTTASHAGECPGVKASDKMHLELSTLLDLPRLTSPLYRRAPWLVFHASTTMAMTMATPPLTAALDTSHSPHTDSRTRILITPLICRQSRMCARVHVRGCALKDGSNWWPGWIFALPYLLLPLAVLISGHRLVTLSCRPARCLSSRATLLIILALLRGADAAPSRASAAPSLADALLELVSSFGLVSVVASLVRTHGYDAIRAALARRTSPAATASRSAAPRTPARLPPTPPSVFFSGYSPYRQGQPRRARGPSAGPGAQAHGITSHLTACMC